MSDEKDASVINPRHLHGPHHYLAGLLSTRFGAYFNDYIAMKFELGQRGRELATDHLICRFCGNPSCCRLLSTLIISIISMLCYCCHFILTMEA